MRVSHTIQLLPRRRHVLSCWFLIVVVVVWTSIISCITSTITSSNKGTTITTILLPVASASVPTSGADHDSTTIVSEDVTVTSDTSSSSSSTATSTATTSTSSKFVHKTVIIPHDSKKHRGGEDAASTSNEMLVVADGVGGWANKGVNPGLYSRLLTKTIIDLYDSSKEDNNNNNKASSSSTAATTTMTTYKFLQELVHKANFIAADKHLGSATCTTLQLVGESDGPPGGGFTINTLNIGDSGYSIHRYRPRKDTTTAGAAAAAGVSTVVVTEDDIELVFASHPGQKRFNFPYQIGGWYGDTVEDVADMNTHTVLPNDVIIVYSDGVSDNLYPHQYHACIASYTATTTPSSSSSSTTTTTTSSSTNSDQYRIVSYSLIADCIARQAYFLGKDKTFDSPFAKGAREVGKRYHGGKHDDITVTVAQIVNTTSGSSTIGTTISTADVVAEEDPHYAESIFVYEGTVPPQDDLPTLIDVLTEGPRKRRVGAHGSTDMTGDSSEDEL